MKRILRALVLYARYFLIYRGNKVRLLRSLGASIGEDCEIISNFNAFGSEPYLIEIGDRCTVAGGVALITHDASSRLYRNEIEANRTFGNLFGPIVLENDVFIGAGAILLPNVRIGSKAVVAAGAVVTTDVPPGIVVAGVPARPIGTLEELKQGYGKKAVPLSATNRDELRVELLCHFRANGRLQKD